MTQPIRFLRHLAAAVVLLCTTAQAQLTLPTTDQGHVRLTTVFLGQTVQHFEFDTSMVVKDFFCCAPLDVTVADRAYAFFDIPTIVGGASAAVLHFDTNLAGADPAALRLVEVSSPLLDFQFNYVNADADGITLFIDLGIGLLYANSFDVVAGSDSHSLALNADALARINAQQGQAFGIGFATLTSLADNPMQLSNMTLEIIPSPVPESSTAALLLAGLALVTLRLRRRVH